MTNKCKISYPENSGFTRDIFSIAKTIHIYFHGVTQLDKNKARRKLDIWQESVLKSIIEVKKYEPKK